MTGLMSRARGWMAAAWSWVRRHEGLALYALALVVIVLLLEETVSAAAMDPWSVAASKLCTLFTGTIGRALTVVAVVLAGIQYSYGEGGAKSNMAALVFGVGMVLLAPQFLNFFFGGTLIMC